MLAVSTSRASSERTLALPAGVPKAVGVHPSEAAEGAWDGLRSCAARADVVAIGEAGFDDAGPAFVRQREVFAAQAAIARELALALVLHVNGAQAWREFLAASEAVEGLAVVRHYFTGDAAQAAWHSARGHHLSFGRPLMRDVALQVIASRCPADLLLIETDSYPIPGRATEPRDLVAVARALADTRGWTLPDCANQLWRNGNAAFGLIG